MANNIKTDLYIFTETQKSYKNEIREAQFRTKPIDSKVKFKLSAARKLDLDQIQKFFSKYVLHTMVCHTFHSHDNTNLCK